MSSFTLRGSCNARVGSNLLQQHPRAPDPSGRDIDLAHGGRLRWFVVYKASLFSSVTCDVAFGPSVLHRISCVRSHTVPLLARNRGQLRDGDLDGNCVGNLV